MKQTKVFLVDVVMVMSFMALLGALFGSPFREQISEGGVVSAARFGEVIVGYCILAIAFVIFLRLKYWILWAIVLIAIAVLGSGADLPYRFFLYSDKLSLVNALLTLGLILVFWGLEKGMARLIGTPHTVTEQFDPFYSNDDSLVTLSIGHTKQSSEEQK